MDGKTNQQSGWSNVGGAIHREVGVSVDTHDHSRQLKPCGKQCKLTASNTLASAPLFSSSLMQSTSP